MKQTIRNLLVILALLSLVGCSSDEDTSTQPEVKPGSEVQFNIGFAPSTRATTDIAFNTVFEDGDEIGVFATKNGSVTDIVAQNVKLVRVGGNWTAATDADKIYYPMDGRVLDFEAYYPYQGDHDTTKEELCFEVKADQSTATNYNRNDHLRATAAEQSNNLVNLSFTHLMAMIQITVDRVTPVPAFREGTDGFKVILKNVKLNTVGSTILVDTSAPSTDITMYRVPTTDGSWVFRALIPSQLIDPDELFAFGQALQGNVIDMEYTINSPTDLQRGKSSTYKVTLDYQLDPDHTYVVGDIYPYKGTPVGIVYATSNAGKNGKVLSMDEGYAIKWANEDGTTNATDGTNGLINMKAIFNIGSTFSDYPAFAWTHAKNNVNEEYNSSIAKGVWYLPAKNELQDLYNVKDIVNMALTFIGAENLSDTWYWSSSEASATHASAFNFGTNLQLGYHKGNILRLRAIMNF